MMIDYSRSFVIFIYLSLLLVSLPVLCKTHIQNEGDDPVSKELESYAEHKVIPDEMREVILTALSFYPELRNTKIKFLFKDNIKNSVMQAQPKISSIFRKKSVRRYVIKISRYLQLNHEKVDIATLPFEVLVGWIGHELGHIMDYKDRGVFSMLGFGVRYVLSTKFVLGAEKTADLYALKHGLGNNIVETKNFVLNHADIPTVYKERIKRLYMSPEEFELLLGEVAPESFDD